jgi:hypothetical protein
MKSKFRILCDAMIISLVSLFLFSAAGCSNPQVQQPNPLYVKSQDLWQQLSGANLSADTKALYSERFHELEQEQHVLWDIAGQVERGECQDQCIAAYNNRVQAWQVKLISFNSEVQKILGSSVKK